MVDAPRSLVVGLWMLLQQRSSRHLIWFGVEVEDRWLLAFTRSSCGFVMFAGTGEAAFLYCSAW
jgi:hypothetical protein